MASALVQIKQSNQAKALRWLLLTIILFQPRFASFKSINWKATLRNFIPVMSNTTYIIHCSSIGDNSANQKLNNINIINTIQTIVFFLFMLIEVDKVWEKAESK